MSQFPSPYRALLTLALPCLAASLLFASIPLTGDTQIAVSSAALLLMLAAVAIWRDRPSAKAASAVRVFLIVANFALYLRYLVWRGSETLPFELGWLAAACGMVLFLTECYCFVHQSLSHLTEVGKTKRVPLPLPADHQTWPTVDVFIPTYDEDPNIVRTTVIAATQMDFPAEKLRVYILDDGGTHALLEDADQIRASRRAARVAKVQEIASRYGATYLTRESNEHAKAGNLNHALRHSTGEFIAVLDCDHVPTRDFITQTLGLMLEDPKRFLVQTPHHFVSPDPIERNLSLFERAPAENELFYREIQPGLDTWGASFFCGSAALLRRSALEDIGGFATTSITEDAETTLAALAKGYNTAYLNTPLVSGLQPETFTGFIGQRTRWSQGMLQIFLIRKPWKMPGLTHMQRLLFTNLALFWLFPVARLLLLLAPIVTLLLGVPVADARVADVFIYGAPALLASALTADFLHGRLRWPFISMVYEVVQSVHLSRGIAAVITNLRAPTFNVTPKGEIMSQDFLSSLARPFYVLMAANIAALTAGAIRFMQSPDDRAMLTFVSLWAIVDFFLLLGALGSTFEHRQRRAQPRIRLREPVLVALDNGTVIHGMSEDISATGARINLDAEAVQRADLQPVRSLMLTFPSLGIHLPCSAKVLLDQGSARAGLGCVHLLQTIDQERTAIALAFGSSAHLQERMTRRHRRMSFMRAVAMLLKMALIRGVGHLGFMVRRQFGRWVNSLPTLMETKQ